MIAFPSFRVLFALLALISTATAAELPGVITLRDGGLDKEFEVACDELHCRPPHGTDHPFAVPKQADAQTTSALAKRRGEAGPGRFDLVLYQKGKPRTAKYRRSLSRRILVTMDGTAGADEIAEAAGASAHQVPSYSDRFVILSFAGPGDSLARLDAVRALPGVAVADPLLGKRKLKKLAPNDARYAWSPSNLAYQWHLNNTGQNDSVAGLDVNIESVWDTYLGDGVTIAIVDDGLEVTHPDLAANVDTENDRDWNDSSPDDPTPFNNVDDHGTSCAGIAAARGNNTIGVTGAAPRSKLVGLRLIAGDTTDAEDAEALGWRTDVIDISNNSWGESDDGDTLHPLPPLMGAAISNGVEFGRGCKGTIYIWAAGNGRASDDRSNYEGYNNAPETISVGAVDFRGKQAPYSEAGANLVVSAPSDADLFEPAITTTTLVSRGTYTNDFGGTSAAAPAVAGVVALMLQANPSLGWRDVQEILIRSAEKVDPTSPGWSDNGAGFHFHHGFGAGMVDAAAALELTMNWHNLTARQSKVEEAEALEIPIPDEDEDGVSVDLQVSGTDLRVEHAVLAVTAQHEFRGDLTISLTSPSGTESVFTEEHFDENQDIDGYRFLSVRHWGEMSNGTWTVKVIDSIAPDEGTLQGLSLTLYGTSTPAGYDLWASTNITSGPAGDIADADGDGRLNLYEYALGGDPMVPDTTGTPQVVGPESAPLFQFVADTSKTDITYGVKVSNDLTNWTPVATSVVDTNGPLETRQAPMPTNFESYFVRLEITRP